MERQPVVYRVRIKGVTPLITHRYYEPPRVAETPQEQAIQHLYLNSKGECCIPAHMVYACLVQAGKHGGKSRRKKNIAYGIHVKALDGSNLIPILVKGKPTTDKYEVFSVGIRYN